MYKDKDQFKPKISHDNQNEVSAFKCDHLFLEFILKSQNDVDRAIQITEDKMKRFTRKTRGDVFALFWLRDCFTRA